MPSAPTPHRTPLRRVSQGSLFRLSRSNAYPDAPHGLGFLEPAMAEFLDETEALQANVEGLNQLSQSLRTFNESFASWLYVMNMNSLATDFPQAPDEASEKMAKLRDEQDAAEAAAQALEAAHEATKARLAADRTMMSEAETTIHTGIASVAGGSRPSSAAPGGTGAKKVVKAKLTPKEKKERSIEIEKIIATLPLEFRGSDPNLRRNMEQVIEKLAYSTSSKGAKITDLLIPPDLNQARANKCLIALVNRKIVVKDSSTGTMLYHWKGMV